MVGRDNAGLLYDGYSGLLLVGGVLSVPLLMLEVRQFGSTTWSLAITITILVALAARTVILTKGSPWGKQPQPRDPVAQSKGHKES